MSVRSTLPAAWALDRRRRSVLLGLLRQLPARPLADGPKTPFTFRNGMQTLPTALAAKLSLSKILYEAPVKLLEPSQSGVTVHAGDIIKTAPIVVIAADAKNSGALLEPFAPELAADIQAIPYAPIGILHLAVQKNRVRHLLNGFGVLTPASAGYGLLGVIFNSSTFSGRAPDDTHLLTCFCGGARNPQLCDVTQKNTQNHLLAEVSALLGVSGAPEILAAAYIPRAIPNYPLGHFRVQERVREHNQTHPNVKLLGNWNTAVRVTDRVEEGFALAREIETTLRRTAK